MYYIRGCGNEGTGGPCPHPDFAGTVKRTEAELDNVFYDFWWLLISTTGLTLVFRPDDDIISYVRIYIYVDVQGRLWCPEWHAHVRFSGGFFYQIALGDYVAAIVYTIGKSQKQGQL